MDTIEARAPAAPAARAPRITNACEACRAAKVKCQASSQLGICKRCLDSKRECIFKTGPRTRRPRQPKRPNPTTTSTGATTAVSSTTAPPRLPPPPGPSKTFTIDIPMSADDEITDTFEAMRLTHEQALDKLMPNLSEGEDDDYDEYGYDQEMGDHDWLDQASASGAGSVLSHASSLPVGASALSTPPSSVVTQSQPQQQQQQSRQLSDAGKGKSRTLASLRLQPQFNLGSAGKLLERFKEVMLDHYHCVVVREEETVASMAKERPFVLLAVLAATSGSSTLQGHSLYDEEFRKVLGLKFVAGGERTLELLQGLVIYISWYPFHLRPKNRQAIQYIRMVADIVSDLELDEDPGTDSMEVPPTPERLNEIRLYLASYYLASSFASLWGRSPTMTYTDYTAHCSDLLQQHSPLKGDHLLAWQVRLERLVEETNDLRRTQRGHSQSEYQIGLMIRGMETQLTEWEARMEPHIAATLSIRMAALFARAFLHGAPLLKLPSSPTKGLAALDASSAFRADPQQLMSAIPAMHDLFEYVLALEPAEINAFIGAEWGSLILAIILGFRMSFALPVCPEWDDRAAREAIRFGEYIDRFCRLGGGGGGGGGGGPQGGEDAADIRAGLAAGGPRKSMDVLSASKIVLEMVKQKYWVRVSKLEDAVAAAASQQRHWQQERQQLMEDEILAAVPPPISMSTPTGAVPARGSSISGCPMMDGSLESYYPYWDETFNSNLAASAFGVPAAQGGTETAAQAGVDPAAVGPQNDLWTAMTMGWAQGDLGLGGL